MPRPPVPPEVDAFLAGPNPAVVATVRPDGAPHAVPTWYLWDGGRVLLNMAATRARLDNLRREPRIALTVLAEASWYVRVNLFGRVTELVDDPDLADIDRLSLHYGGERFHLRDEPRVSAWVEVDRWDGWNGARAWQA